MSSVPTLFDHFILTGHRGGLFHRPENTLAAFRHIANAGIQWVECDIRLSGDGVAVLHHDDALDAPDGGRRPIRSLSLRELEQFDVGGGERIPTLRKAFGEFAGRLHFDLELKELDAVEEVIALVREFGMAERVIVTSFSPEAIQAAARIAPEIRRGLLVDGIVGRLVSGRTTIKAVVALGCTYFLPHYSCLSPGVSEAARAEGLKVIPWTVNRKKDAVRALRCGIDGLISDKPDILRPLIKVYFREHLKIV